MNGWSLPFVFVSGMFLAYFFVDIGLISRTPVMAWFDPIVVLAYLWLGRPIKRKALS